MVRRYDWSRHHTVADKPEAYLCGLLLGSHFQ
jgi:hypothetical protein